MMSKRIEGTIMDVPSAASVDHRMQTMEFYVKVKLHDCGPGAGIWVGTSRPDDAVSEALDFIAAMCQAFGAENPDGLIGKRCFALYSFPPEPDWWGRPAGLESADTGRRFVFHVWEKKWHPDKKSPIVERRETLEGNINFHQKQIAEHVLALLNLDADYTDWENEPVGGIH